MIVRPSFICMWYSVHAMSRDNVNACSVYNVLSRSTPVGGASNIVNKLFRVGFFVVVLVFRPHRKDGKYSYGGTQQGVSHIW